MQTVRTILQNIFSKNMAPDAAVFIKAWHLMKNVVRYYKFIWLMVSLAGKLISACNI